MLSVSIAACLAKCHASSHAGSVTCNGAEWDAPLLRWKVADLVDEAADGDLPAAAAAHRKHSSMATSLETMLVNCSG